LRLLQYVLLSLRTQARPCSPALHRNMLFYGTVSLAKLVLMD
jgi:hypothetical protein